MWYIYECVVTSTIAHKIKLNEKKYGPAKCPIYVRLPWISPLCHTYTDKFSNSIKRCFNAVMIRSIFQPEGFFPHAVNMSCLPINKV